jgi:predicted metal-binding membrane protein
MRQAFRFGAASALVAAIALFWPLVASFFVGGVGVIIWMYGVAIVLDIVAFVVWLGLAIRYSRRAAQGEFFDLPWLSALTGRASRKP